jgi:acetyltransferase-like isoleucine patch superfamily enzyme
MIDGIRKLVKLPQDLRLMVISQLPGPIGYALRYRYWKTRLKHLGNGVIIEPGVYFQNPKHISIGDCCWIDRGVIVLAGIDTSSREKIELKNEDFKGEPGDVHIGRYVHVAPFCIISGISGGVYISDYCSLSANSKIYALSHHYRSGKNPKNSRIHFSPMVPDEEQCLIQGAIQIGENTGVALNSVILPGVFLPENCFVAMNSVVGRGKYLRNTIISGNPAESGKTRFRSDE